MLHTELPIYKKGSELLGLALDVEVHIRREFKKSVGARVHDHCVEMLDLMAMANATQKAERTKNIEALLVHQRAATVLLRVAFDRRLIAPGLWAQAVQLLESIGKQAGGWLKHSREKAPAA